MRNTSEEERADRLPYWSYVLALLLFILLFIFAVLGNALALWILRHKPELRTLTHAFLTNLVISDLLLAMLTPFEAAATYSAAYVFGDYGCKLQRTSLYFFYAASILTLSAISVERYIAICYPMKYDDFKERKTRVIFAIWLTSAALVVPHIYLSEERTLKGDRVCFQFHTTDETRAPFFWGYSVPCFLLLYLVPLVIMSVTYWRAAQKLSELESRLEVSSTCDLSVTVRMRKEVLRMLLVVVVLFLVQWTPFEMVELLESSPGSMDVNPISSRRVAVHMLAFSNAVFNPVVFGFMSKPFREGFKEGGMRIIKSVCCGLTCDRPMCSCWDRLSIGLGLHYSVRQASSTDLTSFPTSSVDIDWDSSSGRLNSPVSIVENQLPESFQNSDVPDCPDHKL